jgi:Tfp pilus assembly protein PilV
MAPTAPAQARRSRRIRRGDTIVEALVALLLLSVGALALVGLTTTLARDERRAAARRRGAAMLEARLLAWCVAPCADGVGATTADGLTERWSSRRDADSMLVLVDSVQAEHDPSGASASLVAARGCEP